MQTVSHERTGIASERPHWRTQISFAEMWASLAIIVIWLSVLVDAIFGPDIVTTGVAGDRSSVPSAVAVALFAFLATWVVARYGFRHERKTD